MFFIVSCGKNETDTVTVSLASSLTEPMQEIAVLYQKTYGEILDLNFGGSGALKEQILNGADVDVFISASKSDMDELVKKEYILEGSKVDFLKNELVMISGYEKMNLDDAIKIAIGDPKSVPAGRYAKSSLEYYNLYDKIEYKLVFAQDVRTVLSWVETKATDIGFVYSSDAKSSDKVNVIEIIDSKSHDDIVYPYAIIKTSTNVEKAEQFLEFLNTKECRDIFIKYGFGF